MGNSKKESNKLSIIDTIVLCFKNIFKLPGLNGERRLLKNIFNGKIEWTKGREILPINKIDINDGIESVLEVTPDIAKDFTIL